MIRINDMLIQAESDGFVSGAEMAAIARRVVTNAAGKMTDKDQFAIVRAWATLLPRAVSRDQLAVAASAMAPADQEFVRRMPAGSYYWEGRVYEGAAIAQLQALTLLSYEAPPKEDHTTRNVVIGAALGTPFGLAGMVVGGWIGSWF